MIATLLVPLSRVAAAPAEAARGAGEPTASPTSAGPERGSAGPARDRDPADPVAIAEPLLLADPSSSPFAPRPGFVGIVAPSPRSRVFESRLFGDFQGRKEETVVESGDGQPRGQAEPRIQKGYLVPRLRPFQKGHEWYVEVEGGSRPGCVARALITSSVAR